MFKNLIKKIIHHPFVSRAVKALIRPVIIHEKSEKFRRDVVNAIQAYEFEKKELEGVASFSSWEDLLEESISRIDHKLSTWVELGVMTGASARKIASTAKKYNLDTTIHGFDSFEGLPETWHARAKKGAFAIKQPKFKEDNIEIHVGWFDNTIPEFVKKHPEQIGFLHADADLYSSTKMGFDTLNISSGTVILFDEYWNYPEFLEHEYKAFSEFLEQSGKGFEYIGYYKDHMQLAVIIK